MPEQKRKYSDWYIPSDWAFLLGLYVMAFVGLVLAMVFPSIGWLKSHGPVVFAHCVLYYSALSFGCVGVGLLFSARLPLYRQRRFLAFGPRELDRVHRRLYWLAYFFIGACVLMLTALLLMLK